MPSMMTTRGCSFTPRRLAQRSGRRALTAEPSLRNSRDGAAPRRSPRRGGFQPRFTLMLLYFFAFLIVFCFALVSPALFEICEIDAHPVRSSRSSRSRRCAGRLRGRLWIAVAAATATTGLGIWARVLPGLRPPG